MPHLSAAPPRPLWDGFSNPSVLDGLENPSHDLDGLENPSHDLDGLENPSHDLDGLENPSHDLDGLGNPLHNLCGPSKQVIDVSVCIANWNCRELLRACLHSLVNQPQGVRLEVIVVDNASTDGAAEMVALAFPRVRLIRNDDNRGFAVANNQAARLARGRYLFFLNNDTVTPPGALGELVEFLEAHPEVILVGPSLVGPDARPQAAYRNQPSIGAFMHRTWLCRLTGLFRASYRAYRRRPLAPVGPCEVDMLLGAALMIARRRFDELGGWDEAFAFGGEDLDLSWRARQLGAIVHYPRVAVTHVGSASTKENIAFASPRIAAGLVRHFRKSGATARQLLLYKLAVTLDAPVRIIVNSGRYLLRVCLGKRQAAARSWTDVRRAAAFLARGLGPFWKA